MLQLHTKLAPRHNSQSWAISEMLLPTEFEKCIFQLVSLLNRLTQGVKQSKNKNLYWPREAAFSIIKNYYVIGVDLN